MTLDIDLNIPLNDLNTSNLLSNEPLNIDLNIPFNDLNTSNRLSNEPLNIDLNISLNELKDGPSIAIFLNYAEEQNTKSFPLNNFFIRKLLGIVELTASWSYKGRWSIQGPTSYFQEATSFNMGVENCTCGKPYKCK